MSSCSCWRNVIILMWPVFLLFGTSRFPVVTYFLCDQRRLLSQGEKGATVCFLVIVNVPIYSDPSAFQLTVARFPGERASCNLGFCIWGQPFVSSGRSGGDKCSSHRGQWNESPVDCSCPRGSRIVRLVYVVDGLTSVDPVADQQMSPHDLKSHWL